MPPSTPFLERKTPENPRFQNVRPRLDTGPNMRKVLERLEGTSGAFAHKRPADEFYVKLRPSTLGALLEPLVEASESIYNLGREDTASVVTSVAPESAAGTNEGNILIYDVRSFEAFMRGHVFGAQHYDKTQLSKSTNNFPREVYFYRGPVTCDKMVVIYDEDGKAAREIGNAFVQKGIENTYVVSGGFLGLCAACPSVLEGEVPEGDELAKLLKQAGLKPAASGSQSGAASSRCSTAGSVRTQRTGLTSLVGGS
eukprot:CAMPEP_0174702314 /NCGR_PEP_ID=MMETSP1094-20130205/6638_1 /TAXON_ID=156173 /ORGANISM="Chrysochromulina brevifilum, Strain UTEX LB 985" /LENGTH=254 /DNA_ID=CAMNT_0015900073 /DNA_START=29 /DNA_END=790 /DNA_ORIENTATION=-